MKGQKGREYYTAEKWRLPTEERCKIIKKSVDFTLLGDRGPA